MKKIYLVSAIMVIFGLVFYVNPHWFRFLQGFRLLFLPVLAGMLLVFVQKEKKIYRYLPKLILGSLLTGFVFCCLIKLIECFDYSFGPHCPFLNIFSIVPLALMIASVCIFGGLIGIIIKKTIVFYKKNSESKYILALNKVFGAVLSGISAVGAIFSVVVLLILFFNPSSSLLLRVMVDFRLIDVIGAIGYYLLLLSLIFVVMMPLAFIAMIGLLLFLRKNFFKFKPFLGLSLIFFLWLAVFTLLFFHVESRFKEKRLEMKDNQIIKHFDIKDFKNIQVSKFVKYDEIIIKQGDQFNIIVKGGEYDQLGLEFEKINDDTLYIKRSDLETYYNTDTWTVENRENILFPAGTKDLEIEIVMPDLEKVSISGGNVELVDIEVDNIEIELNKRFNNIKGNITVENTLKLDAYGGIINLSGSVKNLIVNSGDCWIEMDKLTAENATINAKNTSRLNVYVSNEMEIQSSENSGILNHLLIADKEINYNNRGNIKKYQNTSWYQSFLGAISINEIELDDISQVVVSAENKKLIASAKGEHCAAGLIFQYDISKNTIARAIFNDKEIDCIAWPEEFGSRDGLVISLQGSTVDAGCIRHMYYSYNYDENVVELKRECYMCGRETEKCYNY